MVNLLMGGSIYVSGREVLHYKAVCILGSPKESGNTATIVKEIVGVFESHNIVTKTISLGAVDIKFCVGCKNCYQTGKCIHNDDVNEIVEYIFDSDIVLIASPSYWGDVTAQMKQFIDRCTPYCDTNESRLPIPNGKHGVAIAIRAGQNKKENENLLSTIEHFLGHLDIPLEYRFTVESIDTEDDLNKNPSVLKRARDFGNEILKSIGKQHLPRDC